MIKKVFDKFDSEGSIEVYHLNETDDYYLMAVADPNAKDICLYSDNDNEIKLDVTQIKNTNETVTEIENENTNENLNESLTENLVENTTPQPTTTTTSAIKKEQKEDSNDIGAIIVFIIIVAILIFAYKSATKTKLPKYDGETPICPRCGKSHYHAMVTQEVVVPEKTKTQSSLNLNPLKPFTVMNHKQKVVQREISREVVRFVCDECGNIWS